MFSSQSTKQAYSLQWHVVRAELQKGGNDKKGIVWAALRWLASFYLGSSCLRTQWCGYVQTDDNQIYYAAQSSVNFPHISQLCHGAGESQHQKAAGNDTNLRPPWWEATGHGGCAKEQARTEGTSLSPEASTPLQVCTREICTRVLKQKVGTTIKEVVTLLVGRLKSLNKVKMVLNNSSSMTAMDRFLPSVKSAHICE